MSLPEEETTTAKRRRWMLLRVEYILLIVVVVIMTIFAFAFFYFQVEVSRLKDYGYLGVFLVNFIGAASMILPTPRAASVVGGGAGLPSPLRTPPPSPAWGGGGRPGSWCLSVGPEPPPPVAGAGGAPPGLGPSPWGPFSRPAWGLPTRGL